MDAILGIAVLMVSIGLATATVRSFRSGEIYFKPRWVCRNDNPADFWIAIVFYIAIVAFSAVMGGAMVFGLH